MSSDHESEMQRAAEHEERVLSESVAAHVGESAEADEQLDDEGKKLLHEFLHFVLHLYDAYVEKMHAAYLASCSYFNDDYEIDGRLIMLIERSFIFETRVESAAKCRDRGSEEFKQKNILKAVQWYERALYHVDFDEGTWHFEFLDKHRNAVNEVRLPVYLNLAACYLNKTNVDFAKVIENADLALAIDPENTKALYRGGKAHLLRDDLDDAKKKLTQAAKHQPNDKNIREALVVLKLKLAEQKQKEKQTWGGRFLSSAKTADSDGDDDDAIVEQESSNTGSGSKTVSKSKASSTETQSNSTFWIVALLILVLAAIAGFLLVN